MRRWRERERPRQMEDRFVRVHLQFICSCKKYREAWFTNAFELMILQMHSEFSFVCNDSSDCLFVSAGHNEAVPDCIMQFACRLTIQWKDLDQAKQCQMQNYFGWLPNLIQDFELQISRDNPPVFKRLHLFFGSHTNIVSWRGVTADKALLMDNRLPFGRSCVILISFCIEFNLER